MSPLPGAPAHSLGRGSPPSCFKYVMSGMFYAPSWCYCETAATASQQIATVSPYHVLSPKSSSQDKLVPVWDLSSPFQPGSTTSPRRSRDEAAGGRGAERPAEPSAPGGSPQTHPPPPVEGPAQAALHAQDFLRAPEKGWVGASGPGRLGPLGPAGACTLQTGGGLAGRGPVCTLQRTLGLLPLSTQGYPSPLAKSQELAHLSLWVTLPVDAHTFCMGGQPYGAVAQPRAQGRAQLRYQSGAGV